MKTLALLLASLATASAAGGAQRPVASHAVGGLARPPQHEVVRVNSTSLTSDRLDAAVGALLPMESFHRNVGAEKMAELRQRALQTLVDDELAYQEGVRVGVTVAEADVQAAWTQAAKRYGGTNGFEAALRQSGSSRTAALAEFRRTLTIGKLYGREVTAKCVVTRDEAARFFVANPERFVEPDQLHIFAITVGVDPSSNAQQWAVAKDRAEQALHELNAGSSFADVALKYSTDPSKTKGGDMGFVHRGSLSDQFEQVAKELPVGRFSGVVQTLFGYHIVRVSEVRPAQKKTFAEVSTNLQKDLTASRCAEQKDAWVAGLRARANIVFTEPAP